MSEEQEQTTIDQDLAVTLKEMAEAALPGSTKEVEDAVKEDPPEGINEEDTSEGIEVPHWVGQEDEEFYAGLSDDARDFVSRVVKDAHDKLAGNGRQLKELEKHRATVEQLQKVLEPYKGDFAKHGVNPIQGIQNLFGMYAYLNTNPREGIQHLMNQLGVTRESLYEQEAVDPQLRNVQAQLQQLQAQNQQLQQGQAQATGNLVERQLAAFRDQVDGEGKRVHPHFENEEVQSDMALYVRGGLNMEEAYQKAVKANGLAEPPVRRRLPKPKAAKGSGNGVDPPPGPAKSHEAEMMRAYQEATQWLKE